MSWRLDTPSGRCKWPGKTNAVRMGTSKATTIYKRKVRWGYFSVMLSLAGFMIIYVLFTCLLCLNLCTYSWRVELGKRWSLLKFLWQYVWTVHWAQSHSHPFLYPKKPWQRCLNVLLLWDGSRKSVFFAVVPAKTDTFVQFISMWEN